VITLQTLNVLGIVFLGHILLTREKTHVMIGRIGELGARMALEGLFSLAKTVLNCLALFACLFLEVLGNASNWAGIDEGPIGEEKYIVKEVEDL